MKLFSDQFSDPIYDHFSRFRCQFGTMTRYVYVLLSIVILFIAKWTFVPEKSYSNIVNDTLYRLFSFLPEQIPWRNFFLSIGLTTPIQPKSQDPLLFWNEESYRSRFRYSKCFTLALVTDLDLNSKVEDEFKWKSFVRLIQIQSSSNAFNKSKYSSKYSHQTEQNEKNQDGEIIHDGEINQDEINIENNPMKVKFNIYKDKESAIYTEWNRKNRGMELSALIWAKEKLYAFCDVTGIVYEIDINPTIASPKHILTVGGNIAFKSEWAAIKDGKIYVGSIGKEWVTNKKFGHTYMENIQKIDLRTGFITVESWHDNYMSLRTAINATWPGYIIHEGAVWHPDERKWYFLPRKVSQGVIYTEENDEIMGSNFLLIADENFKEITVKEIGPIEKDFGFSDIELLYGNVFAAIKVREHADSGTDSKLIIFDASTGELLSDWIDLGDKKYEGLTTVSNSCEFSIN